MSRDYSLDQIGKRLSGDGLTDQERVLAADDLQRVDWIRSQFRSRDGEYVLDIGASDGAISRLLYHEHSIKPWLIEQHSAHLQSLLALTAASSGWLAIDDAFNVLGRMPEQFFDTALLCEVLEHQWPDRAAYLFALATRVAKRVIVTVPNRSSLAFDTLGRGRWDWPDHRSFYDASALATMMGISLADVQPIVGDSAASSIWLGGVWAR